MAMQLITARRFPRRITFAVWLDTTKTITDPANPPATIPDPAWVLTQDYELGKGERKQPGEADAAYRARIAAWMTDIRSDMRGRCVLRLAELIDASDPGVALPGEGQVF